MKVKDIMSSNVIVCSPEDSISSVAQLLKKHKATVLKPEQGTNPNVFYIREYSAR